MESVEQRRSSPPAPPTDRGVPIPAVFLTLCLLGAIVFNFEARLRPVSLPVAILSFAPFLMIALAGCGVVWLVRRALRRARE
jgi:hypothetical protein